MDCHAQSAAHSAAAPADAGPRASISRCGENGGSAGWFPAVRWSILVEATALAEPVSGPQGPYDRPALPRSWQPEPPLRPPRRGLLG
jgi:hypothetical protein